MHLISQINYKITICSSFDNIQEKMEQKILFNVLLKCNHALIFSEIFLFYLYKLGYNFKNLLSGLVRLITVTNNVDRKPEIYNV